MAAPPMPYEQAVQLEFHLPDEIFQPRDEASEPRDEPFQLHDESFQQVQNFSQHGITQVNTKDMKVLLASVERQKRKLQAGARPPQISKMLSPNSAAVPTNEGKNTPVLVKTPIDLQCQFCTNHIKTVITLKLRTKPQLGSTQFGFRSQDEPSRPCDEEPHDESSHQLQDSSQHHITQDQTTEEISLALVEKQKQKLQVGTLQLQINNKLPSSNSAALRPNEIKVPVLVGLQCQFCKKNIKSIVTIKLKTKSQFGTAAQIGYPPHQEPFYSHNDFSQHLQDSSQHDITQVQMTGDMKRLLAEVARQKQNLLAGRGQSQTTRVFPTPATHCVEKESNKKTNMPALAKSSVDLQCHFCKKHIKTVVKISKMKEEMTEVQLRPFKQQNRTMKYIPCLWPCIPCVKSMNNTILNVPAVAYHQCPSCNNLIGLFCQAGSQFCTVAGTEGEQYAELRKKLAEARRVYAITHDPRFRRL